MQFPRTTRTLAVLSLVALALTGCAAGGAGGADADDAGEEMAPAFALPTDIRTPTGEKGQFADLVPADEDGVWIAAGSGQVAPLQYVPEGGDSIIGIVADLTAEYAHRLDLELKIEQVSGGGTMPGVESGRYDAALAAGDFAERRTTVSFVDILKGGTALLGSALAPADISGVEDLCGHSLAVTISSIQQTRADEENKACTDAGKDPIDIQAYDSVQAAVLAVQSQQAEVAWSDISPINVILAETPGQFELVGDLMWYAPYGVAIAADRADMAEAVRAALQSMLEDGTYAEILARWGSESLAMDEIEINGSEF
ncbi:transporter substrate-binding domain-containing protein [Microbacterium resistens]|uniref:transporter substrate-binding domain-containing protein n=1 Tax=Microbacterium resistens TaxID=156977 RepID=UPI00082F92E9|nr:transporter substrate-binding domain-containing protein [Microbacterium resistens]